MSLKDDLYAAYKKAELLETLEACRATEYQMVIHQRDALLSIAHTWEMPIPDAYCRHCDAPMSMRKWAEQYCHVCRPEE